MVELKQHNGPLRRPKDARAHERWTNHDEEFMGRKQI